MDLLGNWNSIFPQMTRQQIDQSVSTAEIGDLIEFVNPLLGLSLWGVYVGEGHVIHFGVGDENMTQKACRSFIQQMVPKSNGDRVLKKTKVCKQRITDIKVPPATRIRVNNNNHNLVPSPLEMMTHRCETFLHQEFKYDLMNFNSEHFATFVRHGYAVCNQIPFKKKNEAHTDTTETLQMIMQQRMETET
ncbi:retinoic acid receptor responder protein 3-like isoform X1 [Seriola lalandi dorsalis]|uniref:retinoic acid receptor responder protein 3-like isoform X1 n=1 Tax=Seriola lalandi dorsalis TaxID=1841481 RepID=UPI000C6F5645|nr:retinoic acid receptor responder protein 3-like isoform X1 [Seriola lalandi dorsalis]